jgi:hypothetical protein
MRVFNLAEELEKERKKNKELEKYLKCKKEYTKYLPEDVEFVLLTRPDYNRHQEELQDKVFKLQDIIDKAKEYINTHSEMTDFQIYGIENILTFRGSLEKLLDILQGDNK